MTAALTLAAAAAGPAPATAAERVFTPVADTYTRSDLPSTNFGDSVRTSAQARYPERRAYLRFNVDLPAGSLVTAAKLQLSTTTSADGTGVQLRPVDDDSWGERSLTHDNAPAIGPVVSSVGAYAAGATVELDATAPVGSSTNRFLSVALTTTGSAYRAFDSRETISPPRLVVTTLPETTIVGGLAEALHTPSRSATFAFEATEPGAGFQCRLDASSWSPCASPVSFSALDDGPHAFEVRAVDRTGPDPTPARRAWLVDTTAPGTDLDASSTPADLTRDTGAAFWFSSPDAAASFECRVDDDAFAPCRAPAAVGPLPDGRHQFEVRAVDLAGNRDPAPASWSWVVDRTAPSAPTIAAPGEGATVSGATVTLSGSAEDGAVVRLTEDGRALADAPVHSGAWTAALTLEDGTHTITGVAADLAGNVSPAALRHLTVDSVAPDSSITTGPSAVSKTASASFAFTSDSAGARFECRLDGSPSTVCVSPKRYSRLPDGEHTFQVRAVDAAGNADPTPATRTWRIDTVLPAVAIDAPATGSVYTRDTSVDVLAEAKDDAGVTKVEFWEDDVRRATRTAPPYSYQWKAGAKRGGRHRWAVRAYDAAWNIGVAETTVDVNIVAAAGETQPVPDAGDAADDPAIWVHPSDPGKSLIIGTDKLGGLALYDLSGSEVRFYADSRPNNVDLRYGFPLDGDRVALVVTTDRSTNTLRFYRVVPATRELALVGSTPVGRDLYGLCLYTSRLTGSFFAFVTYNDGRVLQWRLDPTGTGGVQATLARQFAVPGAAVNGQQIAEGCVADDEQGVVYIAEEDAAVWRYPAEPGIAGAPVAVDRVRPDGHLTADIEGLALYRGANGTGYLVASSQGSDEFAVYDRSPANAYVARFGIGEGTVDRVGASDGIEITSSPLGAAFPEGTFVAHDGYNPLPDGTHRQNFKLVRWGSIARGIGTPLLVDTRQRADGSFFP